MGPLLYELVGVLVIALASLEISLHAQRFVRILGVENFVSTCRSDPILHHKRIPKSWGLHIDRLGYDGFRQLVTYNSVGTRGNEPAIPKPPNLYRILLLGDSFVEAAQVALPMTVGKRLENHLAEYSDKLRFEVVSYGVFRWSPSLEYLYYKNEGVKLKPDLVVLCVCHNDVMEDNTYFKSMKTDERDLPLAVAPSRSFRWRDKTVRRLKIYYLARDLLTRSSYRKLALQVQPELAARTRISQGRLALFNQEYSSEDEMLWDRTKKYILALKEMAAGYGQQFVLVCIPFPVQVPNQFTLGKLVYGLASTYCETSEKLQEVLEEFSADNGIHFVDLLPTFREAGKTEKLYFNYDGHFNERGNDLAARCIAEYITANVLTRRAVAE
jgi:hypothetical protein